MAGGAICDLDAELESYASELIDRQVARGIPPAEARRRVLVKMGGIEEVKERTRDAPAGAALESLLRDVRYGCRTLRRTPVFAVAVAATLALGIGANVTMFSVMRTVLWQPLPYPAADRLVLLSARTDTVWRMPACLQAKFAISTGTGTSSRMLRALWASMRMSISTASWNT